MIIRRWPKLAAITAGWALLGLVLSVEVYFNLRADMQWVDFTEVALPQFVRAAMWAGMAPLILQLRLRVPLNRGHWIGGVAFHLSTSFLVMATYYLGRLASYRMLFGWDKGGFLHEVVHGFYGHNLVDMAYYWAVLAFGYGAEIQRKYKSEELRTAQLEARLVETELKTLREQLRPHFLFNTLNTIAMMVRERKNDEAVVLLARLGTLLRTSLDRTGTHESTLREELDFLQDYIEIQRARFSDRLTIRLAIAPEALEARIPQLLLQPIVENAILHGIAPKAGPGWVQLGAQVCGGSLLLEVSDDGAGLPEAGPVKAGIGLINTRERLAKMYGERGRMTLRSEPGQGLAVLLTLPFHR